MTVVYSIDDDERVCMVPWEPRSAEIEEDRIYEVPVEVRRLEVAQDEE